MDYPIPANTEEILELRNSSVNEEIVVSAIAGVVQIARNQGKSLEDLTAEILQDDSLLELERRRWLSDIIARAWTMIPTLNQA